MAMSESPATAADTRAERDASASQGVVLVVDDDATVARAFTRILRAAGYVVQTASNGRLAVDMLGRGDFDVVLSDIAMPGMDGVQLLRSIRERHLDIPVVLITGGPSIDTAVKAVEYGAFRYLTKPVENRELRAVVERALFVHRMARIKRQAAALSEGGVGVVPGDLAGLEISFQRAMASLWIAYQPIVRWSERRVYAYEALMRSEEPSLPHPGAVLEAAERLDRVHDLGRTIRALAVAPLDQVPPETKLFVNLHASDLADDSLLFADTPLAQCASRVVLEITERSRLDRIPELRRRVARLRELGYRVAVDDLGAGYAGLNHFTLLEPEVVKLDMTLVRDVDREPTKQRVVGAMISLCRDMGLDVVAEGVETEAERDTIVDLGCDLLQGYLFSPPGRPFPRAVGLESL